MPKLSIIIPCYNEYSRLNTEAFLGALKQWPGLSLCFVNDASTDQTGILLSQMSAQFPAEISVITHPFNKGKSESVRTGFLFEIEKKETEYVGYIDADLSISFEEFFRIVKIGLAQHAEFLFASRIKMLDHQIERTLFRHLVGRFIASITDSVYQLKIYDTQCGAKLFNLPIAQKICSSPFHTRWLFDIEIFLRIREYFPSAIGMEIPLLSWKERGKSKITIYDFPLICKDLYTLFRRYK